MEILFVVLLNMGFALVIFILLCMALDVELSLNKKSGWIDNTLGLALIVVSIVSSIAFFVGAYLFTALIAGS